MEWKNTDPRIDINKRADIVICRPDAKPSLAHVDTKEVDCIFTNYEDYSCISESKKWNNLWLWTWAPYRGKYDWCKWKNTDPRLENDVTNIVIVNAINQASLGKIDNDKMWSIETSYENHEIVDVDEDWDEDWWWIFAPGNNRYER